MGERVTKFIGYDDGLEFKVQKITAKETNQFLREIQPRDHRCCKYSKQIDKYLPQIKDTEAEAWNYLVAKQKEKVELLSKKHATEVSRLQGLIGTVTTLVEDGEI